MNDERTRVQPDDTSESGHLSRDGETPRNDDDPTIGQFEELFQQFENDRKEGKSPKISEYLERVDPAFRLKVLRELILVDVGLSKESGRSPSLEDYLAQCSGAEERAVVRAAFAEKYPEPSAPAEPVTPRSFGEYVILEELSRGGMGIAYKARLRNRGRLVVIKTILPEHESNSDLVDRFQEEIKKLTKMEQRHPNVVIAYHEGVEDSDGHRLPFVVMEFIEGMDLREVIRTRGPLPVAEACDYTRQVAAGLGYLLEQKLIHRDIKPSNIILGKDDRGEMRAVIVDLGVALDMDGDSHLTVLGQPLGTPDYISPEAATDPHGADTRADIYSLGCTLYHLLVGRPPFHDRQLALKLIGHLQDEPPRIEDLRSGLPAGLADVVRKMMAKRPEDRYQTPQQVARAMEPYAKPKPATPVIVPGGRTRARIYLRAAVVAALVLAGTLVAVKSGLIPSFPWTALRNRSEQLTSDSWTSFKRNLDRPRGESDKQAYQTAITYADLCIREFKGAAERLQTRLVAERAEIPTGKVAPADRERIFANGLLNDVATCLWIKGRSHEELGQLAEARQAYEQATHLTHGRCWNEDEELFWSPAEKAGDDLANLEVDELNGGE